MNRRNNQVQSRERDLEKKLRENQLREYLSHSLFNCGLPREVGRNICYINSVLVALRCVYSLFSLLVDSRIQAFFFEFWNDQDPLWNFSSLIIDMCKDVSRITSSTKARRDHFIEVLRAFSDRLANRNLDINPVPQGNAQGDPMQLLLFLKDLLLQSVESISVTRYNCLNEQKRRPLKLAVCDKALDVSQQLERILAIDLMPIISDWNRCNHKHTVKNTQRVFLSIPVAREHNSIRSVLLDYFAVEEFEKRCEECGNARVMCQKAFRLEEMPEKVLAIGLSYNGRVDEIVILYLLKIVLTK